MVEIKISTPNIAYRFIEDGTKDELTITLDTLIDKKQGYLNRNGAKNVIIPYNLLKMSSIEIYNIK
tara:strand:- start:1742 stop:1939 length:198 start_codon:yes stop_codon:yes gene_type:complete